MKKLLNTRKINELGCEAKISLAEGIKDFYKRYHD
jgi:nucleoside-diphosphate-sugar epimerase